MPALRLLLWYWGRRGAGAQITRALASALRDQAGVSVALSISAQSELRAETEALDLPVDAVPTYSDAAGFLARLPRVPARARRLRRQAEEFGADAVVSVMTHLWTPLVAPCLKRAGLRFVPMVHDAEPHPGDPAFLWNWRLRTELAAATEAIVFSESVAAGVRRRRPDLPLHRLPLGAPLRSGFVPAAPRAEGSGTHFVHLGRLRPYKGLDLLRDAWPLLRERHPDATLLVAGEGDAEALAPGLAALPGVEVRQRWLGEEEMTRLVGAADAVVLSYREASQSGLVALGHALGVPAVATPVGGLAEQVADGTDGVLATAVTPVALAEAMAALCDPARRRHLAAGARKTGRQLKDWDAIAAQLVAILSGRPETKAA